MLTSSQNICGMSVVSGDYDSLRKYNVAEIWHPTPKPDRPVLNEQNKQTENLSEEGPEKLTNPE